MGRGKREMKRIENKASRQVTFNKRSKGLLKKAEELSILCDASVALVVSGPSGKRLQYPEDFKEVQIIIDEYIERKNKVENDASFVSDININKNEVDEETQPYIDLNHVWRQENVDDSEGMELEKLHVIGGTFEEESRINLSRNIAQDTYENLKQAYLDLQKSYRQMNGHDIEGESLQNLKQLEDELEIGRFRVRSRREMLYEEIANKNEIYIREMEKTKIKARCIC